MAAAARSNALDAARLLSGVLLVVLAIGVVISVGMVDEGVQRLGFTYLAGRWSNPVWQAWDLLFGWLLIGHAGYGMQRALTTRTGHAGRLWWSFLIWALSAAAFAVATITILTFNASFA